MKRYIISLLILLGISTASCQTLNQQHVGMYDALLHGATCDSNTLNGAIAATASLNKQLILSPTDRLGVACDWDITSAVSVPATRHLYVPPGSMLLSSGGTLTMDSCPIAGRYQIFSGFTTNITLRCERAYPEWFGSGPTTFQLLLDAMTLNGGIIDLGRGTYTQNAVIAKSNVVFQGKGINATKWVLANAQHTAAYGGPGSSSSIVEDTVFGCGISDLEMDGNAVNNGSGQSGQGLIGPRGWTRCTFDNLYIHNTYTDAVGSFIRVKDSVFKNLHMATNGRSCFGITGGSLRNLFLNNTCVAPFNTCWDVEPADGVPALFDADYSFNVVDGLTCLAPIQNGVTVSFGPNVAAGFTGTREHNRFSNIAVKQPGRYGVLIADINNTVMSNISVSQAAFLDPTGYGMWIGGYSLLTTSGVSLTGCTIRSTGGNLFGLYIGDGDSPGVTSYVSVAGCNVSLSNSGYDLRIDGVPNVSLGGMTTSGRTSISNGANPISIASMGQGPAIASANLLEPFGLYSSYIVTGNATILEIPSVSLWHGREITFTFDTNLTLVEHDSETTQTPIYLANASDVYFCAGDTLTLRMSDQTTGETRMQEIGRSRALNSITYTSGGTPPVGCARNIQLSYTAGENITDFTNGESGVNYTFNCTAGNAVIKDTSGGGNFQLAGGLDFTCTTSDVITLKKIPGLNMWHEVDRSVN